MKNGTRKAETRTCPQCGKAFAPKRKNSRYCCVKCLRKAYYLSHLADFAANSKRWRERHPDAYQAVLERYYASHREEVRERERKYRELHRKTSVDRRTVRVGRCILRRIPGKDPGDHASLARQASRP